jgi:cation diffusion facilitator family transporter
MTHSHADLQHHQHDHVSGARGFFGSLFSSDRHDSAGQVDRALETDERGIRALKISIVGLAVTAVLQLVVVFLSGSVALLGDTVHNFADALTSLPLWVAFNLGGRKRNDRYTYGFGRAEDVAGIAIVLVIASSATVAGYEAIQRLLEPEGVRNLWLVGVAGVIGFIGNELVSVYRIRVGREIGSAALMADGMHSRADGLTSLAVVVGALGVAAGFPLADPLAGLLITGALLLVLRSAARDILHRVMDAVDPELVARVEGVLEEVEGVRAVDEIRIRWIGHRLRAEVEITVDGRLSMVEGHDIAVRAHHALLHHVERLGSAIVHANPSNEDGCDHHAPIAHHFTGRVP